MTHLGSGCPWMVTGGLNPGRICQVAHRVVPFDAEVHLHDRDGTCADWPGTDQLKKQDGFFSQM